MRDRLLSTAAGIARLVLVVAAFGLAVGSIGVSATRGFCPEEDRFPYQQAADGDCPGGVQRCLPPLLSSVLVVGDPDCHEEAGGELRSRLVPAFVGSTVLLAGAWYLRPSRLHAREAAAGS